MVFKVSNRRSIGSTSTRKLAQYGLLSFSGSKRLIRTSIVIVPSLIFPFLGREYRIAIQYHVFVVETYIVRLATLVRQRMFEPVGIIALLIVKAVVCAATLGASQCSVNSGLGTIQQKAEFDGLDYLRIELPAFILQLYTLVSVL